MDNPGNILFDKLEIVIKKWNIYLFLLEKKMILFSFEMTLM